MRRTTLCLATLAMIGCHGSAAEAACEVVGDSIGVGIGLALKGICSNDTRVGRGSTEVAAHVKRGGDWTIASLGSNDFPRGISAAQRAQSDVRVRAALTAVADKAGSRLILIIPANGARPLVEGWAVANGVKTIRFAAGRDGIHPRNYAALAREIRGRIGS